MKKKTRNALEVHEHKVDIEVIMNRVCEPRSQFSLFCRLLAVITEFSLSKLITI